tara:strand:+ start:715 stop:1236 length:522 start_codon:yes stop_codon:yes gene_type:complete
MATNLQFIKEETLGSQAASMSITDCFSSAYDVYQVIITKMTASADDNMRFTYIDNGGSEITASNYEYAQLIMYSSTSFGSDKNTGQTSTPLGGYGLQGTDEGMGMVMTVFNPFNSTYTFSTVQIGYKAGTTHTEVGRKGIGVYKGTDSMTGIKFKMNASAEYEQLTAKVYGVK